MAAAPLLAVERASKRFGSVVALDDVSLDVGPGEFFALLGPSGCGKTTLMRLIAGFEAPDAGRLSLEGRDLSALPPHQRPVNMMFQSYALFPHLDVFENIAFGLRRKGHAREAVKKRVEELLDIVQLQGLGPRRIEQLSGGQRQRVALARALAPGPKLLLLDEPLAALDRKLREETQLQLKQIQRRLNTAFVTVTHDQEEALALADRIAVMRAGKIEQIGAPPDVYRRPQTRFVADFIGATNLIEGRVSRRDGLWFVAPFGHIALASLPARGRGRRYAVVAAGGHSSLPRRRWTSGARRAGELSRPEHATLGRPRGGRVASRLLRSRRGLHAGRERAVNDPARRGLALRGQ